VNLQTKLGKDAGPGPLLGDNADFLSNTVGTGVRFGGGGGGVFHTNVHTSRKHSKQNQNVCRETEPLVKLISPSFLHMNH
jgi:hypothetical protein